MIKFEYVEIKNFKSFGNKPQRVNLQNLGTHLITGENNDTGEEGNSANGAGKSAVFSAILFCLFGKDLDKLKADEVINLRNAKNLRVEIGFSVGGKQYCVVRGRKPNFLEFYENGETLTRDSMKNTDEEIQKLIGISYDLFVSVFFMNPFKETFMSMTSAAQRNYMEDVLSLDTLAERAEQIKTIRKDLNVEIKLARKDYENAEQQLEKEQQRYQNLLDQKNAYDKDIQSKIEEVTAVLEDTKDIDFDALIEEIKSLSYPTELEQQAKDTETKIEALQSELKALQYSIDAKQKNDERALQWTFDQNELIKSLQKKVDEYPSEEAIQERDNALISIANNKEKYADLESELKDINENKISRIDEKSGELANEYFALEGGVCPYCKQSHVDQVRMDEIVEQFETLEKERNELLDKVKEIESTCEELKTEIDFVNSSIINIDKEATVEQLNNLRQRVEDEKQKQNPYIHEEDDQSAENRITEVNQMISDNQKEKQKLDSDLKKAKKKYEDSQKKFIDLLGTADLSEVIEMKNLVDNAKADLQRLQSDVNPYDKQIQEFEEFPSIEEYKQKLDDLVIKEKHSTYLITLLTDPKSFIRKNIVDQYVPFLNKKITEYSQHLDLPHTAEIKSDMTVDVEYMTKSVSYFTLSRGERLRLDMATTLAFRDLLKIMGRETNIMMIDEVLDSALDNFGRQKTFSLIKENIDNVMLISHREDFHTMVDSIMTITKENGFSVIDIN